VDLDEMRAARGKTITVDSPGINAYADGEYVCPLPVTVTAVPWALKVLRLSVEPWTGSLTPRCSPKDGVFLVPLKVALRRPEGIDDGDDVRVRLQVGR
jgi:hypothetical protein